MEEWLHLADRQPDTLARPRDGLGATIADLRRLRDAAAADLDRATVPRHKVAQAPDDATFRFP